MLLLLHALPALLCSWEAIQASGRLLRMSRSHIHFATQPQLLRGNSWASVMLRLKLQVRRCAAVCDSIWSAMQLKSHMAAATAAAKAAVVQPELC